MYFWFLKEAILYGHDVIQSIDINHYRVAPLGQDALHRILLRLRVRAPVLRIREQVPGRHTAQLDDAVSDLQVKA